MLKMFVLLSFFIYLFLPYYVAYGVLAPRSGNEPVPSAIGEQSEPLDYQGSLFSSLLEKNKMISVEMNWLEPPDLF